MKDFRIVSLFFLVCLCEKDRFGKISIIGCGQHGGAVDDQKFGHDCSPSMIIWQLPNKSLIFYTLLGSVFSISDMVSDL